MTGGNDEPVLQTRKTIIANSNAIVVWGTATIRTRDYDIVLP